MTLTLAPDRTDVCTPAADAVTEKHYLYGYTGGDGFANAPDTWHDTPEKIAREIASNKRTVLSCLFGHLVRLAGPVVEHYHGDLYGDVQWLDANVDGPRRFVWQAYDCGTNIDDVNGAMHATLVTLNPGRPWWLVDLTHESGAWYVSFTRLPLPAGAVASAA